MDIKLYAIQQIAPPTKCVAKCVIIEKEKWLEHTVQAIFSWCGGWDLNPHANAHAPQTCLSADSSTAANSIIYYIIKNTFVKYLPPALRKKTDKISACPRSISLAPNRQHQTDSPRQYPGGDVIPLEGLAVQADGHRLGETHLRLAHLAVGDDPGQFWVADV